MDFLNFMTSIVGNLFASQIYDTSPKLARWLITRAVGRLSSESRARYSEEWSAHLEKCDGNLTQIFHAFGCLKASFVMQPASVHLNHYLVHALNNRWQNCFMYVWIPRSIPSTRTKTIVERMSDYRKVLIYEVPYLLTRKFANAVDPEIVSWIEDFNHEWLITILEKIALARNKPKPIIIRPTKKTV